MASIEERKGSFRVLVRKNGIESSRTFKDRPTAELWGIYKELLIHNMASFEVPSKDMITIADILEMKRKDLITNEAKRMGDIEILEKDFVEFLPRFASEVKYEEYLKKADDMLSQIVYKGGCRKSGTGLPSIQSKVTVLRKFRVLASAYSVAISSGFNIENIPQKIISIFLNDKK